MRDKAFRCFLIPMSDPVRIEFESIGGDKLLKTIKQLQEDLKATAEAQAKIAKNSSGLTSLAKSLNLTYKEAQKLSEAIGLTGDEILTTVNKIRSLQSVGASTQEIFNALNKEAGITAAQFLVLDKAVGALNANQEAAAEAARRSAEALKEQAEVARRSAEEQAEVLRQRAAALKQVSNTVNFAASLKKTFEEAENLANSLGLTADEAQQAIARLRQLQSVNASVEVQFATLNNELNLGSDQFLALGNAVDALNAEQEAIVKAARDAAEALELEALEMERVEKQSQLVAEGFGAIVLGAGAISATIGAVTANAIQTGAAFEQLQSALNNVFGEAKGAREFDRISEFASKTPFQVDQLTQSFLSLVNRGFIPTNEELTKIGDLAASQSKNFDQLVEAILDAQQSEFERLKEFGINASAEGDKVSLSFRGINQTIDRTPESIRNAIIAFGEIQGIQGSLAAQSATLNGQLSNLEDGFDQINLKIFEFVQGPAKALVGAANTLVGTFLSLPAPVQNSLFAIGGFTGVVAAAIATIAAYNAAIKSVAFEAIAAAAAQLKSSAATALLTARTTAATAAEIAFALATRKATDSQIAQAASFAKGAVTAGLAAGAIAALALAFDSLTVADRVTQQTTKSIEELDAAIAELRSKQAQIGQGTAEGVLAAGEAVQRNKDAINESIGGIQRFLDQIRNFIGTSNELTEALGKLFPQLRILQDIFGGNAQENSIDQQSIKFGELVSTIDNDVISAYDRLKQAPGGLAAANDQEVKALLSAAESATQSLEKERPVSLEAIAARQQYLDILKGVTTELGNVANAGKIENDALQEAVRNLDKVGKAYEKTSAQISVAEAQRIQEITQAQANGVISAEEAERQKLEATQARIQEELKAERTKLAALQALDVAKDPKAQEEKEKEVAATQVRIAQLTTQALEGELQTRENDEEQSRKKLENDYEASSLKLQQTEADRLKEIERLESQGVLNDAQAQDRKLQVTLDRINAELDAERKKLSALEALPTSGDPEAERKKANEISQLRIEIAKKEAEQLQAIREKEDAAREAALRDIEKQFSRVTEAAKAAETDRLIQIQQLLNARQITEERANALRVSATKETIAQELDAEKAKLEELRSLPLPTDPDSREKAEQEIRDSIQRTADLSLQLLQAEKDARDALIEEQKKQIQDAADAENRAITDANRGLEAKKNAVDAVTRSLQQQNTLLSAQFDLENAIAELTRTETQIRLDRTERALEISRQLNDDQAEGSRERLQLERELEVLGFSRNSNEEQILRRRQEIERAIAEENITNVQREFNQKRQLLQLDLEQQRIALRRSEIEARIAENQARQAVNTAQSNLSQAQLTGDQNAIAAAQQDVNLAQDSLQLAQENTAATREQVQNFDQIASSQLRILDIQQQSALALARQANEAERYATALERAQAADRRGGGGSGTRSLRSGGNFEAGEMLKVHKDEYIVPRSPGVVLSQSRSRDLAQQMLQYREVAQNAITRPTIASPAASSYTGDRALLKEVQALRKEISNMRPMQTNQIKVEGGSKPGATVADFLEQQRRNLFRNG